MIDYNKIPFLSSPPEKMRPRPNGVKDATIIVIHTMESGEGNQTAENVANWLHNGADGRNASVHYCVDSNSIIQMAQLSYQTMGAAGMNTRGIHVELAGKANQTVTQWNDEASQATLLNAAKLCAKVICVKCHIPLIRLRDSQLKSYLPGFCGHADVTRVFKQGTHTDPGVWFPWTKFIQLIRSNSENHII